MRQYELLLVASLVSVAGCGVIGGSSIKPTSVNPSRAASATIELLDKDANGLLTASELAASPGLLSSLADCDTSGDKQLDRDEIAARLSEMYSDGASLTSFDCRVLLDNRPLKGAEVRLVPESFLGDAVKAGSGVTDGAGNVSIGIADEDLPEAARGLKKMQVGIFRVEITHPSVKIPAKFNTQTILGHTILPTDPEQLVAFRLQSK